MFSLRNPKRQTVRMRLTEGTLLKLTSIHAHRFQREFLSARLPAARVLPLPVLTRLPVPELANSGRTRATLRRGPKFRLRCLNFFGGIDLLLQSESDFWRCYSFALFFSGVVSTRLRTRAFVTVQ